MSTIRLLDAWERGLGQPADLRPLALLSAWDPSWTDSENAALPVGDRDARLLRLRQWAFGSRLDSVTTCPGCGAELEVTVDVGDVQPATVRRPPVPVTLDAYHVSFRVPTSADLHEATSAGSVANARSVLLHRCITSADRLGEPIEAEELPPDVVDAVEDAMAECDPQADVRLDLTCADCGYAWEAMLDAGRFVWPEVDQWAKRMLVDVATLASSFGWTESQVLELSPPRREAYLELCGR